MPDNLIEVGEYYEKINEILGISISQKTIYCSDGLQTHMINHDHLNCIKYIGCLPDIIKNPDYVGVNPNEKNGSVEFIKSYEDNADSILVGVKVDTDGNYLYVSTIHEVQAQKIERRLYSGRLKKIQEEVDTPPEADVKCT